MKITPLCLAEGGQTKLQLWVAAQQSRSRTQQQWLYIYIRIDIITYIISFKC